MNEVMAYIEIPNFTPKYSEKQKYGSSKSRFSENLKLLLNQTSKGFCMYCYMRVDMSGRYYANIEHAVEKSNSTYLEECVPNLGWACSYCNQSFKRVQENERKLNKQDIKTFEYKIKCKKNDCKRACVKYNNLKGKYIKQNSAHIILQPLGVKGFDTGRDLRIQYSIIDARFGPSTFQGDYSKNETQFIEEHINRFHLNDEKYRNNALYKFLEDVIELDGKIMHGEINNLVTQIFKDRLSGKSQEEILKICKKLYTYYTIKFIE